MTTWRLLEDNNRARFGAASAMFFVALLVLFLRIPSAGLTDDDDFYAPAAKSYAGWLGDVVTAPTDAFTKRAIDRAFKPNHEHPPFAKLVMGVTHAVTTRLGFFGDLDGARAGTSFLAALMAFVMVLLVWRPLGPVPALFAPLILFSFPRFFFHSTVATLDVPVASMVMFTVATFFWAETKRGFVFVCGVVFGLAMATKLNAPFAAFPATLYALASRWRAFSVDKSAGTHGLRVPPIPPVLIAMALIGPVVFLAIWPWMWFDTLVRLRDYFAFHLGHYPILNFYDGEVWTKPHAPWHFAFTMVGAALSPPVLFAGGVGIVVALKSLVSTTMFASSTPNAPTRANERDRLRALLVLQTLFAIGIVAFLPVPKYGGEKLFMPFFALFAIHTADGAVHIVRAFASFRRQIPSTLVACIVATAILAPGVAGNVTHGGGFALSYFSSTVGGIRGAVSRGLERTYYDIADKELARWLDENAPGPRVHFAPNHKEYVRTYRWMMNDGVISRRLVLEKDSARADVIVLTHERRWSTYPSLLQSMNGRRVLYEKSIDGVPLYTVYDAAR